MTIPGTFLRALLRTVTLFAVATELCAQDKTLTVGGVPIALQEITPQVQVNYSSMRFIRSSNVWNVEVSVRNTGGAPLTAPLVLYVESWTGTAGLVNPDGLDGGKPYFDLGSSLGAGLLQSGQSTASRTLTLRSGSGTPGLTTRVYSQAAVPAAAITFARSLNEAGQPLPDVIVEEAGPSGSKTNITDDVTGTVTLGGRTGAHLWKFSKSGYLPVWRSLTLNTNGVSSLTAPRLTPRSTNHFAITPISGGAFSNGVVAIRFGPGSIVGHGWGTITMLDGQTLPALLPLGWSPLCAFWLESTPALQSAGAASIVPNDRVAFSETAALVRWNEATAAWDVVQLRTGLGTNALEFVLPGTGAYSLVVGDTGIFAPPAAVPGAPLAGIASSFTNFQTVAALGTVTPSLSPASRVPELVTARGEVVFTNWNGPLPSGLVLRTEVSEHYILADHSSRITPAYESHIVAYQRPADSSLSTLTATFPLRPLLLFGSDELSQANVHVDVFAPGNFTGTILDEKGGQVAIGPVRILSGVSNLNSQYAMQLQLLNPTNFSSLSSNIVVAFEMNAGKLPQGRRLAVQFASQTTNKFFVLARVLSRGGVYGLEPVERFTSDSAGKLTSVEPASGVRLPGLTGSGQYLLIRVGAPQGVIAGVARDSQNQPLAGAVIRIPPWTTFSGLDGQYKLLSATGAVQVAITDVNTGDSTLADVMLNDWQTGVQIDIGAAAQPPIVISVFPTNNASSVSLVTPVSITFSEPINPGSVLPYGIQLLGASNQVVPASLSFNLKGTVANLLPIDPLAALTVHTIVISTNLADLTGLKVSGPTAFTFKTTSDSTQRDLAAQVISHEPTNGVMRIRGTLGIAEPNAPVVLVNETTGYTSTVLAKSDGSFDNAIPADEEDLLSAVFVNGNGSRDVIPVSRQIYRDGSVGLFNGGGTIEATNAQGTVQVLVEPGSVPGRTKFKIAALDTAALPAFVTNVPPGSPKPLGGLVVRLSGDALNQSMDVSIPINVAELGLPEGEHPTNATFCLAIPREDVVNGITNTIYEIIDRMQFENGRLVTHSPPFYGLLPALNIDLLTVPLFMSVGHQMTIAGRVYSAQLDNYGKPIPGTEKNLQGAVVSAVPPGQPQGIPGRLRPGTVMAAAGGTNSSYAMMVVVTEAAPAVVTASHPRFPGAAPIAFVPAMSQAERFSLGNFFKPVDIVFPTRDALDLSSPTLLFSHSPERPDPGSNAVVKIIATDNASRPALSISIAEAVALGFGTNIPVSEIELGLDVSEDLGAFTRRETWLVSAPLAARVLVQARATDDSGNEVTSAYPIFFGGSEPISTNTIPAPDPNDVTGPFVISSIPSRGGVGVAPGQSIVLRFDEPIDRSILIDPTVISLMPGNLRATPRLSDDQMELTLNFPGIQPGKEYTLTVNSGVRDLSGNRLDQDPTVDGNNSFVLTFTTAEMLTGTLPNLNSGGGAVVRGIYAYVLDRAAQPSGAVAIYDLSNPAAPRRAAQFLLGGGYPRDLVLIPNYSFVRTTNGPVVTKDLLAVVGGYTGFGRSQYLRVIDISDPLNPQWEAGVALSLNPEAVVSRVQWSAPYLGYLESGSVNSVGVIDLQTLILFENMSSAEYLRMPEGGFAGLDANGDGDYVDAGDQLPLPASEPVNFAGKIFSFTLNDSDSWINDFALADNGQFLGVVTDPGHRFGTNGSPTVEIMPPQYRTLYSAGTFPEGELASYTFTNARPRRVLLMSDFPVIDNQQLRLARLALISVRVDSGFEHQQTNRLVVLDVTLPIDPTLFAEIPIPAENGTSIYSAIRREDGMLLLATEKDILIIDPAWFRSPIGQDGVHPAVVGVLPGAGNGVRTFDGTLAGLNIISDESNNRLLLGSPTLQFVSAPTNTPFAPADLVNHPNLQSVLAGFAPAADLWLSRYRGEPGVVPSTLSPALGVTHYYVVVHAPGSAGETIDLALESLNWAGQPLRKQGFLFPPVNAFSTLALTQLEQTPLADEAPVRASKAWRLSSNPASPFYNVYLSRPFALVSEEMSKAEIATLQDEIDRDILWSGAYLRASIDPSLKDNPVLGRFVGKISAEDNVHYPGVEVLAYAYPADYIQSPNPGPLIGAVTLTDALGSIAAHSGELRNETTDMALPGRRLPIEFRRFIGGQGVYDGPFGRGWDFNYNQRVVELSSRGLAPDSKVPLVIRDGDTNHEVAVSQDLLFYTGAGRVIAWKFAGTNAPPEVAGDPLVTEVLGWTNKVARYYLPPPGAFNLMFKFKDGRYARLEPDGTQYWYNSAGRLTKIYDRYDKNSLELVYNVRGELTRIHDELRRPLEIGWWRLPTDPLRRPGIDETTLRPAIAGKICRLLDYSKRDVLFYYSEDGLLDRREGPLVETTAGGGFTGRPVTRYTYSDSSEPGRSGKTLTGIIGGDNRGTPLVAATELGLKGRDTVSKVRVATGEVKLELGQTNSARALTSGIANAKVTNPDASTTSYKFDKFGRPTEVQLAGAAGDAPQKTLTEYYPNGLIKSVTHPEGNRIEYIYDTNHPALRARANVRQVTKTPGPRGGPVLTATAEYDYWYNLPSGIKTDFRGIEAAITLRLDRRDTERVTKAGQVETFTANDFGQIVKHVAIDGITREWVFREDGFLQAMKIGTLETRYGFAPATGVRSDFTLRGLPSSVTDPRDIVTQFIYDERNQLVRATRAGQETSYAYDESGNVVEVRSTVDTGKTLIETRTYDQVGFMTGKTLKNVEVDGVPTDLVTTFEPDQMRRVKRAVFPGGEVHELQYNHVGQLTNYVIGGTYREVYRYDGNGNQTSIEIGGATETRVYDGHDRLVQIITPSGTTNVLSYDENNNLIGKAAYDRTGTLLAQSTAQFDDLDRPEFETKLRDDGTSTASYAYDPANRRRIFTDSLGATLTTYYDEIGRVWKEESPTRTVEKTYDANGNVKTRKVTEGGRIYTEEFAYNDRDQLVLSTDNAGRTTKFDVGMDGRVKEIEDRAGIKTLQTFTILGEQAVSTDPNDVVTKFDYSLQRLVSGVSDTAENKQKTEYDAMGRVTKVILPSNAQSTFGDFDALNAPQTMTLPRGIQIQARYNAEGLMTNRVITGAGPARNESYVYDGLQRLKRVSDPSGSVEFTFDKMGYKKSFAHHYTFAVPGSGPASMDAVVTQMANAGGFRSNVVYPQNAIRLNNVRDNVGRLTALTPDSGEPIIRETEFLGDTLVKKRELGAGRVLQINEFDSLKRVVARRYVDAAGRTLADVRYAYDPNGAQLARQFMHRGGRADFFAYDEGYRVRRADIGVRPALSGANANRTIPGFSVPSGVTGSWAAGEYAREMSYNTTDVLQGISTLNPDGLTLPPMAASFGVPDSMLFVPTIDGFARGRDEAGNITTTRLWVRIPGSTQPVEVTATNTFNALNQLVKISRDDGVVIDNEFGPSGLRIRRKVSGSASRCVPSDVAFIYDGGNLIEERDLLNDGAVTGRYFYGDEGDELIAGDIALSGTNLVRHYFLSDVVRSVLGVTDAAGNLVERVIYDAWGQPAIEAADNAAPQISRILFETNSLLVEFTEAVLPGFNGNDSMTNLVTSLVSASGIFEVRSGGNAVAGTVVFEENLAGRSFGSAFRFVPAQAITGAIQFTLNAGTIQDEANNTNLAVSLNLNLVPGVIFTGAPAGSTAAAMLARSSVNSPFLFHGQVFDYDSGLVYCRARFYDPATGMFLSRDPSGYVDGVNQYAGFANNPVSLRDPTGHATPEGMDNGDEAGKESTQESGPAESNGFVATVLNLGTGAAKGWDLLHSGNPGSQGALDAMRGAELIINDVQTASAAFGVMQLGINGSIGLTRRAAGLVNQFRSSPQIPSAVREHLIKSGLTQIEIDAIIPAMKKHGITRLSIRSFGDKRFARQLGVKQGLPQKPIHIKDKTGADSTITRDGVTYVSDADILHVEVKGRPATLKEIQKFTQTANRNYTKMWNQRSRAATGMPANPPFQHGSHLSMAQMYDKKGKVNGQYMREVGHPGESFTIRADSKGNLTAFDTPHWMTHRDVVRMGGMLRNKLDAAGTHALSFPGSTGWPGQSWSSFRKDWVDAQQSMFFDPVTQSIDTSKMRRFFHAK
ncbi:MAG TPA: Ig-like domain-containing protein [Verrucomicrobiae bacterium]|nr:Ig-like domain-containing protein [Verrucomicrobiae bacterium]